MKNKSYILLPFLTSILLTTHSIYATNMADQNITKTKTKDWTILPYAFSSDTTGLTGGVSILMSGVFQPQTSFVATAFIGEQQDVIIDGKPEEKSFLGGFFYFSDYKLPYTNRTFFSIYGLKSYFPKSKYYIDGSNNSNRDDVFLSSGESDFLSMKFEYVLPIGSGLENPQGLCEVINGFIVCKRSKGGGTPFVTGETSVGVKAFYQHDTLDSIEGLPDWNTNGLRYYLTHDNTDFDTNPSRGYHFQLQYSQDFGEGASTQSWDFLEFKYNQYYNLDTFSFTNQNVLALSLWTGYSFSWNDNENIIGSHRPPVWEGARLGGMNRMRGYDNNRFSDKAVFYATAEYRAILDWNPFKDSDLLPAKVDWFQVVAFAEAGRVNDQYNFDLLTDIKYDVGLSLRALVEEIPVRIDVGYGEEGANMWVMIQQPFDF